MDRLYSPWRLEYVTAASPHNGTCIFCHAPGSDDQASLVLATGQYCYIILNLYPYNSGHLMVVPRRHVGSLVDLEDREANELMCFVRRSEAALTEVYQPHGINVGLNLGRAAGAGVADHLHFHLVPRWAGDTNFMSVVGSVRVLPEEIPQSALRLRPVFARLGAADD
jgi:ATP adenylyltransferase